jgi:hypothetical protein
MTLGLRLSELPPSTMLPRTLLSHPPVVTKSLLWKRVPTYATGPCGTSSAIIESRYASACSCFGFPTTTITAPSRLSPSPRLDLPSDRLQLVVPFVSLVEMTEASAYPRLETVKTPMVFSADFPTAPVMAISASPLVNALMDKFAPVKVLLVASSAARIRSSKDQGWRLLRFGDSC